MLNNLHYLPDGEKEDARYHFVLYMILIILWERLNVTQTLNIKMSDQSEPDVSFLFYLHSVDLVHLIGH